MSITIRPAREPELRLVRDSWAKTFAPRHRDAEPIGVGSGHPWGPGRYITSATAREMLRKYVEEHASEASVLVVAEPKHDEALGWICREVDEDGVAVVHCVYVVRGARRSGLGGLLLDYVRQESKAAGVELRPAVMNGPGMGLWESRRR